MLETLDRWISLIDIAFCVADIALIVFFLRERRTKPRLVFRSRIRKPSARRRR